MERRRTKVRAFAVLGVAGAVLAVALLSPVGAAITKPKVKKIAQKQANKVVDAENAIIVEEYPDQSPGPGTSGFTYDATTTIASLTLPAGFWAYHTDFLITRNSGGLVVGCRLLANGAIVDETNSFETDTQSNMGASMQHASNFTSAGTVEVRCDDGVAGGSGDSSETDIDIVAIQGSSLT